MRLLLLTRSRHQKWIAAVVVVLVIGAGYIVPRLHASGSFLVAEPENGTLSGQATSGTDSSASGGSYVQFGGSAPAFISALLTDPNAVYNAPNLPKPAYLQPITDPVYHTQLLRISADPNTPLNFSQGGSGTWGSQPRHHYSTDQPWSRDGSLIAIRNWSGGSPSDFYVDGNTYAPKYNKCGNYSIGDDWWNASKQHPHERVNINGSTMSWFDVTTCTQTRNWSLPFAAQEGVSEDQSWDGRFAAVTNGTSLAIVDMDPQAPLATYDAGNRRVGPQNDVIANCGIAGCSIDWVGISPSGKYAFVSYNGEYERVFDINPDLTITPHAQSTATFPGCHGTNANGYIYDLGHADMAPNPFDNNEDVLIGQEHCSNHGTTVNGINMGYVVMARLSDGKVTSLTTPTNEAYPHHISTLNYDRPGWVLTSDYPASGERYSNEVKWVKMDGSETVQRLTQTHTDSSGAYDCEAHAVPDPAGDRAIFASCWENNCSTVCGTSGVSQDYIVDPRVNPTVLNTAAQRRLARDLGMPNVVAGWRLGLGSGWRA